jgi:glycosyltransferase involved in cell wall biosynthesis
VSDYCLVVPCYNEERRLDVAAVERFLCDTPAVSMCFVNDGSGDKTGDMLAALAGRWPDRVLALNLAANGGKAEAVRQGMLKAHAWRPCAFLGYWDADLATPLEESKEMLRAAHDRPAVLVVLGLRLARLGADVARSAQRHYLGRVFATMASMVLKLPVYDTQCGAKLVRRDVVPELFGEPFSSRWVFDVEMLARLRNKVGRDRMLTDVLEFPLWTWHGVDGSKMRASAMLKAPLELWAIARRYN